VEHGRTDGPEGDAPEKGGKRGSDACQGDEDDGQENTAQNEKTGLVAVGEVAHGRLDNESEKPSQSAQKAHLGQGQGEAVGEGRQQGRNEGTVKITCEMNQGEGQDDFSLEALVRGFHRAGLRKQKAILEENAVCCQERFGLEGFGEKPGEFPSVLGEKLL